MKQMKRPTFFLMVKTFDEVFQKLSGLIAVVLFVGNWHKKPPSYAMERSIFQNVFHKNLRPDSDSSQKSVYTRDITSSKKGVFMNGV